MRQVTKQPGSIWDKKGNKLADVLYTLIHESLDDAYGRIWIGDDPQPASRFTGDPSLAGGQRTYLLKTARGVTLEMFFTSSDGSFTCVLADEAAEALKG
jgi:hypothetical protein